MADRRDGATPVSMDALAHKAQVGALPVRGKVGAYEVLLVTSRDTGRWIIPKGWPMKGIRDHAAAAQEALEEAGVVGRVHAHPMGAYTYEKRVADDSEPISVMVYLLEVAGEKRDWRERGQRKRKWMTASEAAAIVEEPGLADILSRVNDMPDARAKAKP